MATSERETSPLRHFYGPDPSQFADLYLPVGQRRPGTVVLIHGGWWGPQYGADNLDGVAADLAERGWVVRNIEYRRLGLGGGIHRRWKTLPPQSTTWPRSKMSTPNG
jgi:acetyl esterase/lipase